MEEKEFKWNFARDAQCHSFPMKMWKLCLETSCITNLATLAVYAANLSVNKESSLSMETCTALNVEGKLRAPCNWQVPRRIDKGALKCQNKNKKRRQNKVRLLQMETRQVLSIVGFNVLLYFSFLVMMPEIIGLPRSWALGTQFEYVGLEKVFTNQGSVLESYWSTLVDSKGQFINEKYRDFPIARFGHMLPAGIWSFIIPFQFSSFMRKNFPQLHRISGYVFFLCDIAMMIGLANICINLFFSQYMNIELVVSVISGPIFTFYGFKSWYHAYKRNFSLHREWIIRHACVGNAVHLQRVVTILVNIVGESLNVQGHSEGWFHEYAFTFAIAFSFMIMLVTPEIYLRYFPKAKTTIAKVKQT
eukprot:TRINITY_DN6255_c0_g1_i1.p1 TRINITY_DN6255_c0_g1~~TRINITY_DN6255_c0_g1_i1.p1  ORF type:complete len:361 (-),score=75.62 TRINITY_DN6255_c0_g1_i1:43-1125(-)